MKQQSVDMQIPLNDITDRIAEPPKWWFNGIPRYCDYHPRHARGESIKLLVRVVCLYCMRVFDTAISTRADLGKNLIDSETGQMIAEAWSDPPFHFRDDGFNCAGNHLSSELIAVLQAWENSGVNYTRRPDLEGELPDCPPRFRGQSELP